MSLAPARPFFLQAASAEAGQRFCLFHPPQRELAGLVVYVHPFAEEMNKSRRMAALQSRALAGAGYGVLQFDLRGCGDSSGDFRDATWQGWADDVVQACRWVMRQGDAPLWLWGLRAGCLLAVEAARRLDAGCNFLFWQPATRGQPLLQQFLRLKVANDALAGHASGAMRSLRQRLAEGHAVEVAGYELPAGLAAGLEAATLVPPAGPSRLEWLEISAREDAALSPQAQDTLALWRRAGAHANAATVTGPSFWQTTEIEDAPALLAATLQAVSHSPAEAEP
jgi:exosortase A-associated hydrolase 2